ncbi:hypothetical protein SAMN05192574_101891 [Mucilaginibacter gossypiicola]|uniref:Uncharacterized protein n=1 Tax=Mucilaginibacter gossypiicola TaxID=551995 RepID=A0A1H8BEU0_9SPHI|nr:hypothetical protein SAMN05192574_101891 [Mucilaginibacter gossypiicola]
MRFLRTLQLTKASFRGAIIPIMIELVLIIDNDTDIIFDVPFPLTGRNSNHLIDQMRVLNELERF